MKTFIQKLRQKALEAAARTRALLTSDSGELTTDQLGAWIVGIVIVGLLVAALKLTMPGIFTDLMNTLKEKLNALW